MGRMTIAATHLSLGHRVVAGQSKLAAHIGMTFETDRLFGTHRVDHEASAKAVGGRPTGGEAIRRFDLSPGFGVQAARPVAGFATRVEGIGSFGNQTRVVSGGKIPIQLVVALLAFLGADIFRARDIGQQHD